MRKLLSANFSRLWKDKIFWLCLAILLVYSVVYMLTGCRQVSLDISEYNYGIDEYYFHFALSIGIFCALFVSLFFGTEYSDGTIRNKLIVGHKRTDIYLANLLSAFAATLLMMLVWLLGALVAIPTLGVWQMGIPKLLVYLSIAIMFIGAFSAICIFVNMLCTNKAFAVAISILVILGLLIFASMLYNSLSQPEMTSGVLITANGMEMSEPMANPNYVSGVKREIYEFIVDFLPTGQGLKMWQAEICHPVRMLFSSAAITLLTTWGGIFAFKRKNIR